MTDEELQNLGRRIDKARRLKEDIKWAKEGYKQLCQGRLIEAIYFKPEELLCGVSQAGNGAVVNAIKEAYEKAINKLEEKFSLLSEWAEEE